MNTAMEILTIMEDGQWRTIPEIRKELERRGKKCLDTGVSARLRDLRKYPYSYEVKTRTKLGYSHLVEYQVNP